MNDLIRVLLVDDEAAFVRNLARLLEGRGFSVAYAFDGPQALELVRSGRQFDVAVVDVKMPGMDGVETLRRLKALSPAIEAVMLTGHATLESGIQAIREGAFDYLMKPCDIEDLAARLREAHDVETIRRHPVLWPRNRVAEITCTQFPKLAPKASLVAALAALSGDSGESAAETLFVIDADGRLQGFLTRRDLVDAAQQASPRFALTWQALTANPQWLPEATAADVMHTDTVTTIPEETLSDAAHRMITRRFRSMPVLQKGRVMGIVRIQDIFQHLDRENA